MYSAPKPYQTPQAIKGSHAYKTPQAVKDPRTPQCGALELETALTTFTAAGSGYDITIPVTKTGGHSPVSGDRVAFDVDGNALSGTISGGLFFNVDPANSGDSFTVHAKLIDVAGSGAYRDGPLAETMVTIP